MQKPSDLASVLSEVSSISAMYSSCIRDELQALDNLLSEAMVSFAILRSMPEDQAALLQLHTTMAREQAVVDARLQRIAAGLARMAQMLEKGLGAAGPASE